MRIVGIDASLTATGMSLIYTDILDELHVEVFTIKSKADDSSIVDRHSRLSKIAYEVAQNVAGSDLAVIEAPALSRNTGHVWDRAGLWWMVIDYILNDYGVPIAQVTPSQLKKFASGRGNADKTAVAAAMTRLWDDVDARNDNEFDALALATVGAIHVGAYHLPFAPLERHRATCDAIDWPKEVKAA